MKNISKLATLLLLFAVSLAVVPFASAQSPFDGTWRTNTDESNVAPVEYLLQNGIYQCKVCNAERKVQANGQDQAITPQPAYNTMNVREIDLNSVEIIGKKDGKIRSTLSCPTATP